MQPGWRWWTFEKHDQDLKLVVLRGRDSVVFPHPVWLLERDCDVV